MADIFRQRYGLTGFDEPQLQGGNVDTFSYGLTNALRGLTAFGSQMANRLGMDVNQAVLDEWAFNLGEEAKQQFAALPMGRQTELTRPLAEAEGIGGVLHNMFVKGLASFPSMLAAGGAGAVGSLVAGPVGGAIGLGAVSGALTGGETVTTVQDAINAIPGLSEDQRQELQDQAFSTYSDLLSGGAGAIAGLAGPEAIATLAPVRAAIGAATLPGRVLSGAAFSGAGEAVEGAIPPATINMASEAAPQIGIPEQSVTTGMLEEGALGAVIGTGVSMFTRPPKPYETIQPGQLDANENAALSNKPLPDPLALPPPDPNRPIQQPAPEEQLLLEPPRPRTGGPVETPEVIEQPGATAMPLQIEPPGSRPASRAPAVIEATNLAVPEAGPGADPLVQPMATRWALIDAGFQPEEIDAWDRDEALEAIVSVQRERLQEQGVLNPGEIEDAVAELREQVEAGIVVDDGAYYRDVTSKQPRQSEIPDPASLRVVPSGTPPVQPVNVTPELPSEAPAEGAIPAEPLPVEGPAPGLGAPRRGRPRVAPIPLPAQIEVSQAPPITTPETPDLRVVPSGRPPVAPVVEEAAEPAPLPDRERSISEIFSPTEGAARTVSPEPIGYTEEGARILEAAPTLYDQELAAQGQDTEEEATTRRQIEKDYPQYAGRTELTVDEIIRRVKEDPAKAQTLFEANEPTEEDADAIGVLTRLEGILEQANADDIAYPGDPNNPNGRVSKNTPDHILWLADAARTVRALAKNLNNTDALLRYEGNERLARAGDFSEMRRTFGASSAGRSGGVGTGGVDIESIAGETQAFDPEEAARREQAGEVGSIDTLEEGYTAPERQEAGAVAMPSSRKPVKAYDPYIWVTDEETGEVRRIKNPLSEGVQVEATPEEEARIVSEVAPRAAELRASRDKQFPTREPSNLKGGKPRRQGQGGRGEGRKVVGRTISAEQAAAAGVTLSQPRKSAEAIAKSKARSAKAEAAAVKKAVKEAPREQAPKPETKAEAAKRVSAERAAQRTAARQQKETAKAQRAERKEGKVPLWKPNETFAERQARIFAEIAAARQPKTKEDKEAVREEANITAGVTLPGKGRARRTARPVPKGTASWVSWSNVEEEGGYTAEQSEDARNRLGSKKIGNFWYTPTEETTLGDAMRKVLGSVAEGKSIFANLARAVAERIDAVGDTDMEVLHLSDEQFDHIMTHGQGKTSWRAAFWINEGEPMRILVRDSIPSDALNGIYLHEGIHTVTSLELHASSKLRAVINQIMEETGASIEGRGITGVWDAYGMTDEHEFLAEAFSNPEFQKLLQNTKISKQLARRLGIEGWRKATGWDAVVAFVRQVLGFPPKEVSSLEAAMSIFDRTTMARDDTMLTEYLRERSKAGPIDRIENLFPAASARADEIEREANLRPPKDVRHGYKPSSPDAVNAETAAKTTVELARAFRNSASNAPGIWRKGLMYLRSRDNIMRTFENLFPEGALRKFVNALARRDTLSQQMHAEDAPLMREVVGLFDKYKNKKIGSRSVQEVFENSVIDQTNWQIDASIPLSQNTWLLDASGKHLSLKGSVAANHYAALKKDYDSLPADLKTAMKKLFTFYKGKQERMMDGVLANSIRSAAAKTDTTMTHDAALKLGKRVVEGKATPADVAKIGQAAHDRIRATPEFKGLAGPYAPMSRWGDHIVSAKVAVADPKSGQWRKVSSPQSYIVDFYGPNASQEAIKFASGREEYATVEPIWTDNQGRHGGVFTAKDVVNGAQKSFRVTVQDNHVEFFETESEAREAADKLKGDTYYSSVKPVRLKSETGESFLQASQTSSQLEAIFKELADNDRLASLPANVRNQALKSIQQAVYRAAPGTSISKRRLQRKHVAGASRDSLRAMQAYSHSMNNYIAGIETAHDITTAYQPVATWAEAGSAGDKSMVAQTVLNELNDRRYRRAGTYDASNGLVNGLTSWQFLDKLASPAYTLINATQIPMVTLPKLAEKHGLFNSSRALTKALGDIGLTGMLKAGTSDTLSALAAKLDKVTSFHDLVTKGNSKVAGNRAKMLDKLVEYGSLDPDAGFEAAKVRKSNPATKALGYFEDIWRQAPRTIEAVNRYGSALAAYDLAIKKGSSHDAAVEYARDVVDQTQFNYSASNASPIFNTQLGRVALQFMKFGGFMYQLLGAQTVRALSPNTPRAERVQAIKGLSMLVGAHVLMSGFGGLPFEPLRLLVTALNAAGVDVEWMDVENYVREVATDMFGATAAEILTRGLPRIIGADVSNRLSLTNLLLPQPFVDFDERGGLEAYALQFGGPTAGSVVDFFEGMHDIGNGDTMQGIEKMSFIKTFSDISAAVRMGTTGKLSQAGDPVLTYSPLDMFWKSIGIRPAHEAQVSERRAYSQRGTDYRASRSADIKEQFFNAPVSEQGRFGPILQRYNEGLPYNERLTPADLRNYKKTKLSNQRKAKGSIIPRGNQSIIDRALELFPE